jgi:hypothetical protein
MILASAGRIHSLAIPFLFFSLLAFLCTFPFLLLSFLPWKFYSFPRSSVVHLGNSSPCALKKSLVACHLTPHVLYLEAGTHANVRSGSASSPYVGLLQVLLQRRIYVIANDRIPYRIEPSISYIHCFLSHTGINLNIIQVFSVYQHIN